MEPAESEEPREEPGEAPVTPARRPAWLVWVVAGAILAVGLVVWLATRGDDDSASPVPKVAIGKPTIVPESDLRAFGRAQAVPVYWAGPRPNTAYELTRTAAGRIFVRYLPKSGSQSGAEPAYLTVGTYPQADGYAALQTAAKAPGATRTDTRSGALVVYNGKRPTSVYFAFPNEKFQVEVFDPSPGRARSLVYDGQVSRLD